MNSIFLVGANIIVSVAAALACKVGVGSDKNSQTIKFMAVFGLCGMDIRFAAPQDFGELLIASISTLIGFVLFYYVIYGIMSLLKVSGNDIAARHSKAFWVYVVISIILCVAADYLQ